MVSVQNKDAAHGARQHGIDLVFLARHREAHMQKVGRKIEVVLWIDERLTDRIVYAMAAMVGIFAIMRTLGDLVLCLPSLMSIRVALEGRDRADTPTMTAIGCASRRKPV